MRVITPSTGYTLPFIGPFPRDVTNTGQPGCFWGTAYIWYCGNNWGATTFELVKIADVTGSGKITLPGQIQASLVSQTFVYSFNFGTSSVSTVACSVTNTSIVVPMGSVSTKDLTTLGTTTPERSFNIPLNCDAGTRVQVMLNGVPHGSGVVGVLALDTAATSIATGVGLQLLYNGTPVTLGIPIAVGTVAGSGSYNIGLSARYYQTAAAVTAGQANSTATFTMNYN
ncbi:type 1 fimbrial protein [Pseudomonas sp. B21-056]|jgi:type 1 fimbria pilin|uniref:fimbrial protein n=1 Tax=Pseudomonas sp. B21-056 TaxID=2895495 RepID=UPI00223058E6|nr:fimbrial protein [Pseudomonas sp. B21-056]UZE26235.1 type 1 fimbrial protein [Pseudomonas sp. B21-056]